MKSKIAYICHPIAGDEMVNMDKIIKIIREINLNYPTIVPFAPYIADLLAMNDGIPNERCIALGNCIKILSSGIINELWIYGERISGGMQAEIEMADRQGVPIVLMDPKTIVPANLLHKINIGFK